MAVLDARTEQFLEPVRIPHLCFAEIVGTPGFRVDDTVSGLGIVCVDELGHLAVDTALGADNLVGVVEPSLVVHFLVHGHLLLGIHYVELGIARHHTHRIFSGIGDTGHSGTAFLGGHDNHSRHGPCSVNRSSRTVLEDLETLDVVRVKTGNRGTDECRGISR